MSLSNCNIRELLTEQMSAYLKDNDQSFDELKASLTAKASIPEVQTSCFKMLTEMKKNDRIKVKKTLETKISKKQIAEDEKQDKTDSLAETKDNETKRKLIRDSEQNPELLLSYENQIIKLRNKLNRLISASRVDVTHHHNLSQKKTKSKSASLEDHSLEIEQLQSSISQYELKIRTLNAHQIQNQMKLREIEDREQLRNERKTARNDRAQAAAGYQSTGEGLLETLSSSNQEQFSKHLKEQNSAIDTKHSELMHEAQALNFPLFIDLLPKYLDKLKLKDPEKEALRNVLKFMKKHIECEQQLALTQQILNKQKLAISAQIVKLNGLHLQLKNLQKSNPNLVSHNTTLLENNKELELSLKNNIAQRKRLAIPALLLLTLSFVSTIPLILTAYGVIPFFIAPALLFSLVATPPALLVAATIGIGIAALVFYCKGRSNQSSINANLKTIKENKAQTKKNGQNLQTLKDETIPAAEQQLKNDENERDRLNTVIKEKQNVAEQLLKQAKDIEPISFAESILLEDKSNQSSKEKSEADIESEQEDTEELSEETELNL